MAAGVGKTYRMLQEGAGRGRGRARRRDRLPRAARPRRDDRAGRGAGGRCRAGASTYRDIALEEMDLPAIFARAPELCLDRRARAHQRARASSTPSATRTSRDVLAAGIDVFSTVNVQHLESLNDQVAELTGVARARDAARPACSADADEVVLIDLTPGGADRAPARRQGLPGERVEAALNNFFRDREPRRAARGRAAPGRRGGRGEARACAAAVAVAHARRRAARGRRAAGRRRAAARAGQAAPRLPARRAPRVALGAAARRRARPAVGQLAREPDAPRSASSSRRCGGSPPCSARTCSSRRATTSPRSSRASRAERGTTYVLIGHAAAAQRAAPADRAALPDRLLQRCPASTCASSPTAVAARAGRPPALTRCVGSRSRARRPRRTAAPARPRRHPVPVRRPRLAERTLDAALRLARAEGATLVPGLPGARAAAPARSSRRCRASATRRCRCSRRSSSARPARRAGRRPHRARPHAPPRAARADRARALRHARRPRARRARATGFDPADVAWLLEHAPGEVLVLRPEPSAQGATPVSRGHLTA